MVVNNLHIRGTRGAFRAREANTPLTIDAEAILPLSISPQPLKPVAGQYRKIIKCNRRFSTVQLQASGAFNTSKRLDTLGPEAPHCEIVLGRRTAATPARLRSSFLCNSHGQAELNADLLPTAHWPS
jgi:hypothetical protein